MAAPASSSPAAATALSAFMRGVERRALVVSDLQCGQPGVAERVVTAALRAFASHAAELPMPQWPVRFWTLLASSPQFRGITDAQWPAEVSHLASLADGDRLALLLRIGAGLDEAIASQVLGVSVEDYQRSLEAACPIDAHGQPDAMAWRSLAEAVQLHVRDVSAARVEAVAAAQEDGARAAAAAAHPAASTVPTPPRASSPRRRRAGTRLGWRHGLIAIAIISVLAAAVVGWQRNRTAGALPSAPAAGAVSDQNPVMTEELAAEDVRAVPPSADPHAASDAAMLADPDFGVAQQADFFAWVAAGGPVPVDESQAAPSKPEAVAGLLETVGDEE